MPTSWFILLGIIIVGAGWVPLLVRGLPVSLAIVALAGGFTFFLVTDQGLLSPTEVAWAKELTRIALVLAIMTAGLSIDRLFNWRRGSRCGCCWASPCR